MSGISRSSSSPSEKDDRVAIEANIADLKINDTTPLTEEAVQSALAVLCHNADGSLVYAEANLSSLHLTSISALSAYKHLQRLLLDNNNLHTLQPLRELHFLVYLSATNNKLGDDVFDDLTPSATTLERLNLSSNELTSLKGIQQLPYLIDFIASHNQIEEIDNNDITALHSLTRLNLASNRISRIHLDAFARCNTVRRLDLSNNNLVNAQFVMHLSENLESLMLDHNSVERLTGFEVLHNLVWLHLAHNRITDWEELYTLTDLMNLRQLTLEENPFLEPSIKVESSDSIQPPRSALPVYNSDAEVAQDVDFVASRVVLPQLELLDGSSVSGVGNTRSGVSGNGNNNSNSNNNNNNNNNNNGSVADGNSSGNGGNVNPSNNSKNSTAINSVVLSTIAAPPARGLVHHIPAAPQEISGWNDDSQQELEQLSQYERNRFRVISIARQIANLDSVPVAPEEIQRAGRLFKNRGGKTSSFAAGSAARAVESQRKKISNDTV
ncbi:Leucine-rich repeat [Trypanosoma melophagium]|uniref:Leucine-rich repeat n=1 Tax=Trypanosoma melophagium TaxID=715481 RepID=UPI00351A07F5|nr:Leucine-rich repeat [Trypanosoma melophagium]